MDSIIAEYFDKEEMFQDSEVIRRLAKLPAQEQRIMIIYAEFGSLRKMAKYFNCNKDTLSKVINAIKKKLCF